MMKGGALWTWICWNRLRYSLISGSALFAYLRYSKLLPRKKWIIVPGFAVAAFAAATAGELRALPDRAAFVIELT